MSDLPLNRLRGRAFDDLDTYDQDRLRKAAAVLEVEGKLDLGDGVTMELHTSMRDAGE